MLTQKQYETQELRLLDAKIKEVETAPLDERRLNADILRQVYKDQPEVFAERVGWLIMGNYGKGAQLRAESILKMNRNANKAAGLAILTAALEYGVSNAHARSVFTKYLTPGEQAKLTALIEAEIYCDNRPYRLRDKKGG